MPLSQPRAHLVRVFSATAHLLAMLAALQAHADCAAGDGVLTTPGVCTTPQILIGATGTIVSGATLSTGLNRTAYSVSSNNAMVTNSGVVTSQGQQAVLVNGTFAGPTPTVVNLTNNGSIRAPSGNGIFIAGGTVNIVNQGNISGLLNAPARVGPAIPVSGAIVFNPATSGGTITQKGGTIDGGIFVSGFDTVLNVTGGSINGPIADRTPASGAAGSSQGRGGAINFDLGSGSFSSNGEISVGVVNVRSGTLVLGNDVYVSGGMNGVGLTNSARLQINGIRTVTGDFVQNAGGSLVMQVSPTMSSQLNIARLPFFGGGTAKLAGTLVLAYEPGIYNARNYTLLSAANGVSGAFSTISGTVPTAGLTQSVSVGAQTVDLVLGTATGTAAPAPSEPVVVAPTNDTVFSAVTTTAILNAQSANRMLLDRWGAAPPGAAEAPAVTSLAFMAQPQAASMGSLAAVDVLGAVLPETMARYGGWFWGAGNFASLNGSATAPGFTAGSGGFLAGIDQPAGDEAWLGAAAGYSHTGVSEHSTSNGDMDTGRLALYGGSRAGPAVLSATLGYAYDRISTARLPSGMGTAQEAHDGQEVTAAAQAGLPLDLGGLSMMPRAGIQFVNLFEGNFTESGADGFNLANAGRNTDSLQPYVAFSARRSFTGDESTAVTPELRLGYTREALSNNRLLTVATVGGVDFPVQGVRPSKNMLTAGVELTMQAGTNLYLYADYDAVVPTGNTAYQVVSDGLRIRF